MGTKTLVVTDEELLLMLMVFASTRINPAPTAHVGEALIGKVTEALNYVPPSRRIVRAM